MSTDKGIYMINPISNRSIIVGGRVYKNLLKRGVIFADEKIAIKESQKIEPQIMNDHNDEEIVQNTHYVNDDDELSYSDLSDDEDELAALIAKNSKKQPDTEEMSILIANASKNVMKKYKDQLSIISDDDELYEEVKKLINIELNLLYT